MHSGETADVELWRTGKEEAELQEREAELQEKEAELRKIEKRLQKTGASKLHWQTPKQWRQKFATKGS